MKEKYDDLPATLRNLVRVSDKGLVPIRATLNNREVRSPAYESDIARILDRKASLDQHDDMGFSIQEAPDDYHIDDLLVVNSFGPRFTLAGWLLPADWSTYGRLDRDVESVVIAEMDRENGNETDQQTDMEGDRKTSPPSDENKQRMIRTRAKKLWDEVKDPNYLERNLSPAREHRRYDLVEVDVSVPGELHSTVLQSSIQMGINISYSSYQTVGPLGTLTRSRTRLRL